MNDNDNEITIENLLYKQVAKPQNHFATKVINVYSNKYRINIYCEEEDKREMLIKRKICASYFCQYKGKSLNIIYGEQKTNQI